MNPNKEPDFSKNEQDDEAVREALVKEVIFKLRARP